MKLLTVTAALLMATASSGASSKLNPADFPLEATVKCSYARGQVRAGVMLNGKMVELSTPFATIPLALGVYKMRLVKDKQEKPYEVDQNYEMLMPDGTQRLFYVSGVGDGICAMAGAS